MTPLTDDQQDRIRTIRAALQAVDGLTFDMAVRGVNSNKVSQSIDHLRIALNRLEKLKP